MERHKENRNFSGSTVQSYELPITPAYVAERVERQATDRLYFGTFYDPLPEIPRATNTLAGLAPAGKAKSPSTVVDAKAESRHLLRLQVRNFLKWLQAQGAI